jgi:RNA polymerase sigma-70 factor (ECF subfamily)
MRFRRNLAPEPAEARDRATELLLAARRDTRSFGAFYRDRYAEIFRYLHRRVLCPEIAADITAETFAAALMSIGQFDPSRGGAEQWLIGIARNQLRMWVRRGAVDERARQRLGIRTPTFTEIDTKMIEDREDAGPLLDAVREVLESMRQSDREIIQLRLVDGLAYDAIATRLDCSAGTARVRCSRALAKLRAELEHRVVDLEERLA